MPPGVSGPRCPHCGYHAGPGLPGDLCPECGNSLFIDPATLRGHRLAAVSRRWAGVLAVCFAFIALAVVLFCVWTSMPLSLAALIAVYVAAMAAAGTWGEWIYIAIPVIISMTCGTPVAAFAADTMGPWSLVFLFVLAVPGVIGFLFGRALRRLLLAIDEREIARDNT